MSQRLKDQTAGISPLIRSVYMSSSGVSGWNIWGNGEVSLTSPDIHKTNISAQELDIVVMICGFLQKGIKRRRK